ncbi:MAG TPA: hypothetical protein HPP94_07170 [Desulfuromonadales bacterium]|nr:hypothetical protein [Desulfuromonadales bacterium]
MQLTEKNHTNHQSHNNFIWLCVIVGTVFIGALLLVRCVTDYRREVRLLEERLMAQARVVDENLTANLYSINLMLENIAQELGTSDGTNRSASLAQYLEIQSNSLPGIRTLLVTDQNGRCLNSSRKEIVGQDFSKRSYFTVPRDSADKSLTFMSSPFRSILGLVVISISKPVIGKQGQFKGVIVASLSPEYFQTLLKSTIYAPDNRIALIHSDGTIFTAIPDGTGSVVGQNMLKPGTQYFRHILSGRPTSLQSGRSATTGDSRVFAYINNTPKDLRFNKRLVVAASRNLDAALLRWKIEAAIQLVLYLIIATVVLIITRKMCQALEATTASNATMSRLMKIVAHEFRTPLSLLIGSTDILDRYWDRLTPDKRTEQNEFIRSAARQISTLVHSVISFNELGTVRVVELALITDIKALCRSYAAEIEAVWGTGQQFAVSGEAGGDPFLLDETLFRRILENILTNAFRYTPSNGSVSLNVSREQNRLYLVVADTGIGIPEKDQQQIFNPFYRCENVEGRRGLGLGLSIVSDAVEQLGGSISMSSRIGEGTTVSVTIPVSYPQ